MMMPGRFAHGAYFQEKISMLDRVASAHRWKLSRADDDGAYLDVYFAPVDPVQAERLGRLAVAGVSDSGDPRFSLSQAQTSGEVVYTVHPDGLSDSLRFVSDDTRYSIPAAETDFGIALGSINRAIRK